MHASVEFLGQGLAVVGFEDLLAGGDQDYYDNRFESRARFSPSRLPTARRRLTPARIKGFKRARRHPQGRGDTGSDPQAPT